MPRIRSEVGESNFRVWIEPLEPHGSRDALALAAPTSLISASVNRHFVPLIAKVLTELAGRPCAVQVAARSQLPLEAEPHSVQDVPASRAATFARFVVGETNSDAYAHARAVAEGRFAGPSPLVLYGGVGLGKTHLATAIGNAIRVARPDSHVVCQSSTDFVDHLLAAMRGGQPDAALDEISAASVLVLDDVHFLAGHAATQEALARLFTVLHERGTPVVLTSDRAPQEIPDVEQRLRRRFEGGVLARIAPPEFDLRRRILLQKAADRGMDLPTDVAVFVAERVMGSGRTLEGALNRFQALLEAHGGHARLTCRLAAEALRGIEPTPVIITPELVRIVVSEGRRLPPRVLGGRGRTRDVTLARQLAMYLCRKYCDLPLGEIAQRFGRRDHSTVLHACTVIQTKRTGDPAFDTEVCRMEELIRRRAR